MRTIWTGIAASCGVALAIAYTTAAYSSDAPVPNDTTGQGLFINAAVADQLAPGVTTAVTYTADNDGASELVLETISAEVVVDSVQPGTCSASNFAVAPTVSNVKLAAGADDVPVGASTITFTDSDANRDGCQGATIRLIVHAQISP